MTTFQPILWCDGTHDPAENMRRDAALLRAARAGAPPVLRVFAFSPPGITVGANQVPERELDLARCAADGIPWAIRPTGGRAIFHAEEWTYALAMPLGAGGWDGNPAAAYAWTSALIAASLTRLGVPAALEAHHARGARVGPRARNGPAAPCFASTARHEVVIGGRKLVGSAQRRTDNALLQQGSVLLGPGHLRLADYLALPASQREPVREALAAASASAASWLGPAPPLERWADALAAELGPGSVRVEGASGAFLLTGSGNGSYTPPFV